MWLNAPPKTETEPIIPLHRVRTGRSLKVDLTGDPLRCFVHFASNRSWPCTGHKCTLCERGVGRRCYAYYPCVDKFGAVAILELTSLTEASLIKQMGPAVDTPIGTVVVTRPRGRRNLPCTIEWSPEINIKKSARYPLDHSELERTLMRIWKLPLRNGQLEEREYLERLNEAIRLKTTKHT